MVGSFFIFRKEEEMILVENYTPLDGETLEEYKYRMFKLKKEENMKWNDIQFLLAHYFDYYKSTDFIRHESYSARKVEEIADINVGNRILCISDTHVPFQLEVENLKDYRNKVDVLVFNGDIMDCQSLSKFSKNYRVSMMEEMIKTRDFMIEVIEYINPRKVLINYGNHELRFMNYLAKKLDADMLELMPETALDLICEQGFRHYDHRLRTKVYYEPLVQVFEGSGIEVEYTHKWWCKVGKAIMAHPSAYSQGILKTSEKAMDFFLRERVDFDTMVLAHTHKVGFTKIGEIFIYEQGCLSDSAELTYTDGKLYTKQQNGFLYIVQNKIGNLLYDKTRLVLL